MTREDVFLSPAAKALEPSERAVMVQPDRKLDPLPNVRLEDAGCQSDDKWYKQLTVFGKPERIEVAPGKHRFFYNGKGSRMGNCYFEITMLPGHIYKPTRLSIPELCNDCWVCACPLEVTDTAPDGKRLTIKVRCCGFHRSD